ncbi:MAG: aldo/keto reductase [Selenomonadaceae bacterium]|nr:aldo/keto reductase [Selenomonadaceae bacterium]
MQYVKFGNTGMDVSRICMGCMNFGEPDPNDIFNVAKDYDEAKIIFERAIELGINYFDTANVYQMGSSEEYLGRLIREFGLDRDTIVVATKVGFDMRPENPNGGGLSRKNIMAEIDHSLKRLGMDYVDVYQIHRLDPLTPLEEIMETLHDVVKSGKARYIGASTIFAWQLERLQNIADINHWSKFTSIQMQYNLIYREEERELLPLCRDRKMAVVPWSPLAGGRCAQPLSSSNDTDDLGDLSMLLSPASSPVDEIDRAVIENLETAAEARGCSMAQEALAWMFNKDYITAPIIGAASVEHLEEAVNALDIVLDDDEIQLLEASYVPHEKK